MTEPPLYTSHYETHRCLMLNYIVILGELILGGIASYPFPELFPDGSLKNVFYLIIASSIVLWVCCLRVIYFYEDHLVLYYPLRPFARKRSFTYEEISSVVFCDGDSRYNEKHLLLRMKSGIKRSCSIEFSSSKRGRKVPLLLRFLKRKGLRIEGHNVRHNDLDDCTEARIERVFGTGEKHIRRLYKRDTKEDNKVFLIFFILLLLFYVLLFVVISIVAE